MTAAAPPVTAGAGTGAAALGEDLREVIDALRAVAGLLVVHPLDSPYISVSQAGIHLMPGGEPGQDAVDSLAALLGLRSETATHHGRTWHTASGRLGRHHICVISAAGTEPGR